MVIAIAEVVDVVTSERILGVVECADVRTLARAGEVCF